MPTSPYRRGSVRVSGRQALSELNSLVSGRQSEVSSPFSLVVVFTHTHTRGARAARSVVRGQSEGRHDIAPVNKPTRRALGLGVWELAD